MIAVSVLYQINVFANNLMKKNLILSVTDKY